MLIVIFTFTPVTLLVTKFPGEVCVIRGTEVFTPTILVVIVGKYGTAITGDT
jgi:hypothetical protein